MTTKQVQEFKETEIGKIPLSQICKIILSGTPKTSVSEYWEGDVKWVTPTDITKLNERYIHDTERKITRKGIKNSSAKLLKKDTIIISARGTVGELCIIPSEMSCNQSCYALEVLSEMVIPLYLFYILKNLKRLYSQIAHGTTFDTITKITFDEIKINLPPLDKQDKIIPKLDNLDSKIENLQKQNKILEQTAQAIFKSWFVDFDGQTEFIDSELGQIPKGWFASNLSNVCEKITDGSHYSPKENLNGTNKIATVKNMQEYNFDFDSCKKISDQDFKQLVKNSCNPETGDVLLSKDGTMGLSMFFYNSQPLVLLSSIAILKPNVGLNFYLKSFLSRSEIVDELIGGHASGSALPRIVLKDLKEFKITIPDEQTLKKFNKLAEQIFKQLFKNSCFIYNLSKIRDSLLPKLMSGELVN